MSAPEALTSRIQSALTGPLAALGLDVEAVEVSSAGKRRIVRVAVDQDGGVTLDDVADATRAVGVVLDGDLSSTMGAQPYTLEVTSRGVDRPLTLPRHWRRNVSRLVKVKLAAGGTVTGRLASYDEEADGGFVLEVSGREQRLTYAEVAKALVQVEFNRPTEADEPELDPDLDTDVDENEEDD
ncbi:ribosome maturation factor RimP [Nocardioides litoris]|uniref:ribosome maturation factor RimP n=1 Tax=Nocardioides litoris TaxID=1926648 RepID=UPI00112020D5|nr:ribosome maturation factor RimP [Nocardioides litoris]